MRGLVKLSNFVAAAAILLLIYWVFVFILVEVFGLKVFRENLTQTFGLSVMGILALMAGSLMINIMLNMTRIADKQEGFAESGFLKSGFLKKLGFGLILLFPLIGGALFAGDYLTSKKKESMLVASAKSIIVKYPKKLDQVLDFKFDARWIEATGETVELMRRMDKNYGAVSILIEDSEDGNPLILEFDRSYPTVVQEILDAEKGKTEKVPGILKRSDFIFKTTEEDRKYLTSVFREGNQAARFSAHDGNYELFYPYVKGNRKIVIYFAEHQEYGKLGS